MDLLEKRILEEGKVIGTDILKIDSFLNQQIDVSLLTEMSKDVYNHFKKYPVNKVLTVESSGIAFACLVAQQFGCRMIFAKKHKTKQLTDAFYEAKVHSFTHGDDNIIKVTKKYINNGDVVLIVDDFMATGEATNGMMSIVNQAGAKLAGIAIAVEKGFQDGGKELRGKGIDLYSLAIVESMSEDGIQFRK